MSNGLIVRLEEFKRLPNKEQLAVLFENQQKTIRLIEGYKFNQRITTWMLGILTTGMGLLFTIIIRR